MKFQTQFKQTLFILLVVTVVSLLFVPQSSADDGRSVPQTETGVHLTVRPQDKVNDLSIVQTILSERMALATLEGDVEILLLESDYLQVDLAERRDLPYVTSMVTQMGDVTFINGGSETPPLGETIELAYANILFTTEEIRSFAKPEKGDIFYQLQLTDEAAANFAAFHKTWPDNYICMALDETVVNCSTMYHWSPNTLEIVPNLSDNHAPTMDDLAIFVQSGPLPTTLEIVQ